MVIVDADFDDEGAFLVEKDDFVFGSAAGGLFEFSLEVFDEDLDLLGVDRDDVVGGLEVRGELFEGHRAAVGGDGAHHGVEFAFFLVFCSSGCREEVRAATSGKKES